jgi:phosphohistidine phosphatase
MLYLIRHADAVDLADDAARPLSKRGRHQVEALAHFLRHSGAFAVDEIWHSPLVRARETAELLADGVHTHATRREMPGLTPESDPEPLARKLATLSSPVALVGHNPHLELLASLLVAGAPVPTVFLMKKCAVLALDRADSRWLVRWHVSPEVLQ